MDHKIVMHYRSRKRILVVVAKKVLTRLTYSWQDGKKICKVYMHIKDSKNQCNVPFKECYILNTVKLDSVYSIHCLLWNNLSGINQFSLYFSYSILHSSDIIHSSKNSKNSCPIVQYALIRYL